jgi:signal transduction histidine kinase
MYNVTDFFQLNWIILYFVYGQVFFVTGLVSALQSRRRSELELARSLHWLAAFGIIHGFNEWGYIFIPIQAVYLPALLVVASYILHLLVLATSYFCLFQFGIRLSRPVPSRGARPLPSIVFILWCGVLILLAALRALPFDELLSLGNILTRYGMALPGSALACLGFLRQARQVEEMDTPRIARFLRGAAYTFAGYAVAGGLMVPAGPFPPASWLNYSTIIDTIGIPVPVFRSICGLVMAYTITRSLEIFEAEVERRIEDAERQRLLAEDRERIGRELHDGIIQSIYATGLALEDTLHLVQEDPSRARERVQGAMTSLDRIIGDIRDYIFELHAVEQSLELENELQSLVQDIRVDTLLEAEFRVEGRRCCAPSADVTAQLTQVAREALSNVVQHAQARHVVLGLRYKGEYLQLVVSDDGVGLKEYPPSTNGRNGQGLANMWERARLMGGRCEFVCPPEGGLTVIATVPCALEPPVQEGSSG